MKQDTIYKTKQYHQFKQLPGNRKLIQAHIKKLIAEYDAEKGFPPITVNEKWECIDGQHRLACAKQLKVPISYRVVRGADLSTVHLMNTNVKNWTMNDYMESYIQTGNEDYKIYKEFLTTYELGYDMTMRLLGNSATDNAVYAKFKQGTFKIKDLKKAEEKAINIHKLSEYYDGWKRKTFIQALLYVLENKKFSFQQFLDKLSYQKSKLVDCARRDQYIDLIEQIYNYHSRDKVSLKYSK